MEECVLVATMRRVVIGDVGWNALPSMLLALAVRMLGELPAPSLGPTLRAIPRLGAQTRFAALLALALLRFATVRSAVPAIDCKHRATWLGADSTHRYPWYTRASS